MININTNTLFSIAVFIWQAISSFNINDIETFMSIVASAVTVWMAIGNKK